MIDHATLQGLALSDVNITGMTLDGIPLSDMVAAYDKQNADG